MKSAMKMASVTKFLRVGPSTNLRVIVVIAILISQLGTSMLLAQQNGTVGVNPNGMTLNELLGKPIKETNRATVTAAKPVVADAQVQPAAFIQQSSDWQTDQYRDQPGSFISAAEPTRTSASGSSRVIGTRYGNKIPNAPNQPNFESNIAQSTVNAHHQNVQRIPQRATQHLTRSVQQISHPTPVGNSLVRNNPISTNKPIAKRATYVLQNTDYQQFENRMLQTWALD